MGDEREGGERERERERNTSVSLLFLVVFLQKLSKPTYTSKLLIYETMMIGIAA